MASAQEVEMLRRQLDELTAQKITENSETMTSSGDGDSTTRTAVCNFAAPSHDAHTERSTTVPDVRNVRSGRQHGTVRTHHDVQVRFQDRRRGRPSERISGTGETIRTDPVPDQVKKGVHYFEHARASEDTSSAECG